MDEQPNQPKEPRKGQFGSSQPNQSGKSGVKSRRTILLAALRRGIYQNREWLEQFDAFIRAYRPSFRHQLTLLRKATDPDNFFVKGGYLTQALQRMDSLEARIETTKNLAAPALDKPTQSLMEKIAAATKRQDAEPAEPVKKPKPANPANIEKPAVKDEKPSWLDQMTGQNTIWAWPKFDMPKAEKPAPPSEKVVLPPVVEGYQAALPGEDRMLTPAPPTGSVMAAFIRNRKIEFVETGHVGNTVMGKIVVSSPGLSGEIFPNVRQSHFKTWQENNFSDEAVPSDMRENWKLYLRSIDCTLVPAAHSTRPTIEESLDYGRLSQVHVKYPAGTRKARKWGTKADDIKRRGPRYQYGDPGADLAALLDEARNRSGTDL